MYDFTGRVALVTGVKNKRGMGRGISLRLAREGADVAVTDKYTGPEDLDPWDREEGWRGIDSVAGEVRALGRRGLAVPADLVNRREITDMVATVLREFGKIDILVNVAAMNLKYIGAPRVLPHIVDLDEGIWDKSIAVTLTATFLICKAVAPGMIARGQGGKIVNISALAAKVGSPGRAWYVAPKFGVNGLTQTLAHELAPHRINVNAVCPGDIVTWGSRGPRIWECMKQGLSEEEAIATAYAELTSLEHPRPPLGRPGRVEDIAALVAFLASGESDYITGQAINVDGGVLMAH